MPLLPGARLKSRVCSTEVIVIRSPEGADATVSCGGAEMAPIDGATPDGGVIDPSLSGGTLLGKRYVDESSGTELLCTKAGEGTLSVNGRTMTVKEAKILPPSD